MLMEMIVFSRGVFGSSPGLHMLLTHVLFEDEESDRMLGDGELPRES